MKPGEIIYHNKLVFIDGQVDKKQKRPCIYLFSEEREDGEYTYSVPLTSSIKSFNKKPENHMFIPISIYNYRKLNFVKIDNIVVSKIDNTHQTGLSIDEETTMKIIDKLSRNKGKCEELLRFRKMLDYIKLFEELEIKDEKRLKRIEKRNKRKERKMVKNA